MKNINIILTIILLIMAGCTGSQQQTDGLITVDVMKSYSKKELILQDFMDVEYIPLETSDDFITTAYIQAIGKKVIIVRNITGNNGDIFFFDRKTGKVIKKINRKGEGGEEYLGVLGIAFDEDNGEMFVNDYLSKEILVYDLFGRFRRSFKHKEYISYDRIYNFDQGNLICHYAIIRPDKENKSSNIFWIISKQDGSVVKEIRIPFKERKSTWVSTRNSTGGNSMWGTRNEELIPHRDSWILADPSSDTIYRYSSAHTMKPIIARTPSVQTMEPEVFLYPGAQTDRYCFLQTVKREFDFENETFPRTDLMYDKQEKKIYEYVVYNADFTNKRYVNLVYELTVLYLINNDEIVCTQKLEASDLVEAYGNGQLKGRLKEIAATLDEESNPVIMLAKYKK